MTESVEDEGHVSKRIKFNESDIQDAPQPGASPAIYFCSVEGCPHKETGFSQKPVWYRHMTGDHKKWPDGRYRCPFENCKCHESGFRYQVHYQHHMEWHVCNKDMLSRTTKNNPIEVEKASREVQEIMSRAIDEPAFRTFAEPARVHFDHDRAPLERRGGVGDLDYHNIDALQWRDEIIVSSEVEISHSGNV